MSATTVFVLKPRPAIRAYVTGLITAASAMGLMVGGSQANLVALIVLGALLTVAGFILVILAVIAGFWWQIRVELDDEGYHVNSKTIVGEGRWADLAELLIDEDTITFRGNDGESFVVRDPAGRTEVVEEIANEVAYLLNSDIDNAAS